MDTRKRGHPGAGSSNSPYKRSKQEMESNSTGLGSKSKPCTKFFSTSGCPFGDNCHFLHYVPGGYNAVSQMTNLGQPIAQSSRSMQSSGGASRFSGRGEPRAGPVSSFGASATAKISVDASLFGAIIGKGGIRSKQICRQTGVKLSIRDHERDPNLKNIELEGTFEQINEATGMVRELIGKLGSAATLATAASTAATVATVATAAAAASTAATVATAASTAATARRPQGFRGSEGKPFPRNNYKTKLCGKFAAGNCTYGDRCHFAHGEAELRRSGMA